MKKNKSVLVWFNVETRTVQKEYFSNLRAMDSRVRDLHRIQSGSNKHNIVYAAACSKEMQYLVVPERIVRKRTGLKNDKKE